MTSPVERLSYRAKKVLGFLVAKGLLRSPLLLPKMGNVKLTVEDFLYTASEVEPRVMAVLPAAILHFPKTFLDRDRLPTKLVEILQNIRTGKTEGPSLADVPYEELRRWALARVSDRRTKPLRERRIRKDFRFRPQILRALKKAARERAVTETFLIEEILAASLLDERN